MFFTCFTPVVRENSRILFNMPILLSFDFPYIEFLSLSSSPGGWLLFFLLSGEYPVALFCPISGY